MGQQHISSTERTNMTQDGTGQTSPKASGPDEYAELLRLGLANHAVAHGLDAADAWPLVAEVLSESGGASVVGLADEVRLRALAMVHPSLYP